MRRSPTLPALSTGGTKAAASVPQAAAVAIAAWGGPAVAAPIFSPASASYLGRTPFAIDELPQLPSRVLIGGVAATDLRLAGSRVTGTIPPYTGGGALPVPVPVIIDLPTGARTVLPKALTYEGPIAVTGLDPEIVTAGVRGQRLTVRGQAFTPATAVRIGGLEAPVAAFLAQDALTVTCPLLPEGFHDVTVRDGPVGLPQVEGLLADGLLAEPPAGALQQAIDEIESSVAEGTVRIRWRLRSSFDAIQIRDETNALVADLPGDATSWEAALPAGRDAGKAKVLGIKNGLLASFKDVFFARVECPSEPPLDNAIELRFRGLEYEDVERSLYGDHLAATVLRCSGGGGAGREGERGGGGATPPNVKQGPLKPGVGFVSSATKRNNEVITGFTLEQPAQKLEIALYYRKLAATLGLELRGHLVHVFPDDGFEDEFTFPPTTIRTDNKWDRLTYYRADSDVGRALVDENDPGPQPCPKSGGGCGLLEIPAGEYLLRLYAVGGEANEPYFALPGNPSDEEIFIPGVPCPPYPQVRVRDVSGEATLPVIDKEIKVEILGAEGSQDCAATELPVRLTASGQWLDACGVPHILPLADSRFEYSWRIYRTETEVITKGTEGTGPLRFFTTCLPYGCYRVELTIRFAGCPVSRTYDREIIVLPDPVSCQPGQPFHFLFPTPDVGTIHGIIGLDPPPGTGEFHGQHPLDVRVLVVPECYCLPSPPPSCAAPQLEPSPDVQFDLGIKNGNTVSPLGVGLEVTDLCPNRETGPKYFAAHLDDLGAIPRKSAALGFDDYEFRSVYLIGRATSGGDPWHTIGKPLHLVNAPDALDTTIWRGSFEEPSTYRFDTKSSPSSENRFAAQGNPIDIEIPQGGSQHLPGTGGGNDNVRSGFTSRIALVDGSWHQENGSGGTRGDLLENEVTGAPLSVEGTEGGGSSFGDGGGGGLPSGLPCFKWCKGGNIFKYEFNQDIYNGTLFCGTIWVIPYCVNAQIGFGFLVNIDYQVTFFLFPFGKLDETQPNLFDGYLYVLTNASISLPCSIRADVLFGVVSVAMILEPEVTFNLVPWLHITDTIGVDPQFFINALFTIYFKVEACAFWGLLCLGTPRLKLIDPPLSMFEAGTGPYEPVVTCESEQAAACEDLGSETQMLLGPRSPAAAPPAGVEPQADADHADHALQGNGGGFFIDDFTVTEKVSMPMSMVSPDAKTTVDAFVRANTEDAVIVNVRTNGQDNPMSFGPIQTPQLVYDPAGAFVANDLALFAVTRMPHKSFLPHPVLADAQSDPSNYVLESNANAVKADIVFVPLRPLTGIQPVAQGIPLSDIQGEPDRVDGAGTVAAAHQTGEAWVAWVRYTDHFLSHHGQKLHPVLCDPQIQCNKRWSLQLVHDFRPNLNKTAIYLRKVTKTGSSQLPNPFTVSPGQVVLSASTPGINIEPALAATASGQVASCVWVHDGVHENLVDDNTGRRLLCSVYNQASGWSAAPQDVVRPAILADFPGLLEPSVILRQDQSGVDGVVAFTAVDKDSPASNTGLGRLRDLYIARLTRLGDGTFQFDDPVRIRGACNEQVYGWTHSLGLGGGYIPIDFDEPLDILGPEFLLAFHETGPIGTSKGSGSLSLTVLGQSMSQWIPPVSTTSSASRVSNIVASFSSSSMHGLHMNEGPSLGGGGQGFGGGVPAERSFVSAETRLEPDLALAGCSLSHQYPGPGARVKARVRVENRGFAGSPVHRTSRRSVTGVELVYRSRRVGAPVERVVAALPLPELQPGAVHELEATIEMPHDPVELVARIWPNPVDRDRSNDSRLRLFGAPAPEELTCTTRYLTDDERRGVVCLQWTNPVVYEEVLIYRDGAILSAVDGSPHRYTDVTAGPGEHTYAVRGRVGVSTSTRTSCAVQMLPPAPSRFVLGFDCPRSITGPAGAVGTAAVDCTLTSTGLIGSDGVRGWQIAVAADGARIAGVSLAGTDAGRLWSGGFQNHQLVGAGVEGAVSAVVLSIEEDVSLPPEGTSTIARLELEAVFPEAGACVEAQLHHVDGLQGAGQPVANTVTHRNRSFRPALGSCSLLLCTTPLNWSTFDCNADGKLDVSDAICHFGYLFLGSGTPTCLEALDYNRDGKADISDGIASLNYLFNGGPESPRGLDCQHFETCENNAVCE